MTTLVAGGSTHGADQQQEQAGVVSEAAENPRVEDSEAKIAGSTAGTGRCLGMLQDAIPADQVTGESFTTVCTGGAHGLAPLPPAL